MCYATSGSCQRSAEGGAAPGRAKAGQQQHPFLQRGEQIKMIMIMIIMIIIIIIIMIILILMIILLMIIMIITVVVVVS